MSVITNNDIAGVSGTANQIVVSGGQAPAVSLSNPLITQGPMTISGALTYAGVTLTNAVTGTGRMVLDNTPTITTLTLSGATTLPGGGSISSGGFIALGGASLGTKSAIAASDTRVGDLQFDLTNLSNNNTSNTGFVAHNDVADNGGFFLPSSTFHATEFPFIARATTFYSLTGAAILASFGGNIQLVAGVNSPGATNFHFDLSTTLLTLRVNTTLGANSLLLGAGSDVSLWRSAANRLAIGDGGQNVNGFLGCAGIVTGFIGNTDAASTYLNLPAHGTPVTFIGRTATDVTLVINGAAAQSADLQQWNVNGGTALAKITKDGSIYSSKADFILHSLSTITGGATGNTPTLTAGPVTGNPTKWLPYDDNGVTRYIPSW